MARKKIDTFEAWVNCQEAAKILTANSGHAVSIDYVRKLGNTGKIMTRVVNPRVKLYYRTDVESYKVRAKKNLIQIQASKAVA